MKPVVFDDAELGTILAQLSGFYHVKVEYAPEVLPRFDKDMAKRLRTSLKRRGITFHVGAAVTAIEATADGQAQVKFTRKGKEEVIVADRVLMAVGRGARLAGLALENTSIAYTPRGIEVDEWMQTLILMRSAMRSLTRTLCWRLIYS